MKATTISQTSTKKTAAAARQVVEMPPGAEVVFSKQVSKETIRQAADYLLKHMPPPAKAGETPAHELLAEDRAAGR